MCLQQRMEARPGARLLVFQKQWNNKDDGRWLEAVLEEPGRAWDGGWCRVELHRAVSEVKGKSEDLMSE